jgi:hypothetical protein
MSNLHRLTRRITPATISQICFYLPGAIDAYFNQQLPLKDVELTTVYGCELVDIYDPGKETQYFSRIAE